MPWVPRDLYELMLDAVRQTQASAAVPAVVAPVVEAPPTPKPPTVTAPPAVDVEIPRAVSDAIAMYAFGDPLEEAANYTRAISLLKAGKPAAEVIRDIRMGGNAEAFV